MSLSPFNDAVILETAVHTKMSFFRKYIGAIVMQFSFITIVCTLIMLSPLARFYIAENVWLLVLLSFLFCASYLSLVQSYEEPVIKVILILHIMVEALTFSVLVTYNDMMFLYQAVLLSTCCFFGLFIYTLQSNWDFTIWVVLLISCGCAFAFSTAIKVIFGGTQEENILSIVVAFLIVFYHSFATFMIIRSLTTADYIFALINAHTLPINIILHSSLVYKPSK